MATFLKRMQDKGFVDYEQKGVHAGVFPFSEEQDYFSKQEGLIQNFSTTASQFASFFTESTDLSKEELEDLRNLIEAKYKRKIAMDCTY